MQLTTPSDEDVETAILLATTTRSSPDGKPVPLKDTRTQLFVGNLPYRVRWQDLKDLFRQAGTVLRADVSLGPDNRSRGYGTVLLATAEDAGRAIDKFNGYSWQTRILEVRPDRLPPEFDHPLSLGSISGFPVPPVGRGGSTSYGLPPGNALFDEGETMGKRQLFVGNLPFHCQWQDLKDLFRQAGPVIRADVALGPEGRSRGFGTVLLATDTDADRAVQMFNGYEFNGRPLKVHHDRFSQSTLPTTFPASPIPSQAFRIPSSTPLSATYPSLPTSPVSPTQVAAIRPSLDFSGRHLQSTPSSQSSRLSDPLSEALADVTLSHVPASPTPSRATASTSPLSRSLNQNPARPGPITLPPPQPVFPIQPIMLGYSPNVSPLYHPASPTYLTYAQHLSNSNTPTGHRVHPFHNMTPHGPPMTPSMPSFSFLPQPSPTMVLPPTATFTSPPVIPHTQYSHLFSPGVEVSPGYWVTNPHINPAVGAPVHGEKMEPSPPKDQNIGDYFPLMPDTNPDGYFPPMSHEILKNADRGDSSPSETTTTDTGTQYSHSTRATSLEEDIHEKDLKPPPRSHSLTTCKTPNETVPFHRSDSDPVKSVSGSQSNVSS